MRLSRASVDRVTSAFEQLDLGDPRRAERVRETVRKLAVDPAASLPEAMGSEAALEGAYRMMNSLHVPADALFEAHAGVTALRAKAEGAVLVIHDTTTFEFGHADPNDVGYLNTGKAGFLAHYSLVVARRTGRPLGITHVESITRTKKPARPTAGGRAARKRSGTETVKKEDRESLRWSRGFAKAGALLEGCRVIHIADREGDNYELLGRAIQRGQRFVIRASVQSRRVHDVDGAKRVLKDVVNESRGVLRRDVMLSTRKAKPTKEWSKAHPPRMARTAELEFSATTVELVRPRYYGDELPASLKVNVVHVIERSPPPDAEPVEWLLYTTESIATADDVAAIVDIYRTRWLIEECNKALKTGCRYEAHQFESRAALLSLLALTLPIACELLWLRASARDKPDQRASDVLTPLQLRILRELGSRKLSAHPTAYEALLAVAALGGHIKNNGDPGWLVLHRGMVKLAAYEEGWLAALAAAEKPRGLSINR